MRLVKQALAALSIVVVVGILVALAAPKAADAVAATLVQVTNSTSSPAHSQDISTTAAQIVEVRCLLGGCTQIFPDGTTGTFEDFNVPSNVSFVITSVDILSPAPQSYPVFVTLSQALPLQTYTNREQWVIQTNTSTLLQFPVSGIVIAPQSALLVGFNFSNGSGLGLGNFSATLHGYFTSN
jgi:hypothetical protein